MVVLGILKAKDIEDPKFSWKGNGYSFGDKEDILIIIFRRVKQFIQNINLTYCTNSNEMLKNKKQRGKMKSVLFLQESSPGHRAGKTTDALKNLRYMPDLVPFDYFFFLRFKQSLKGSKCFKVFRGNRSRWTVFQWTIIEFLLEDLKKHEKQYAHCCWIAGWIRRIAYFMAWCHSFLDLTKNFSTHLVCKLLASTMLACHYTCKSVTSNS